MLPAVCMPKPQPKSVMESRQLCPNCQKELEIGVELQDCKEMEAVSPPETPEQRTIELKRLISEKQRRLRQLIIEVEQAKLSLSEVVERRESLSQSRSRVWGVRIRLQTLRRTYENQKRLKQREFEEVRKLDKDNKRREERLKHVRLKNFSKKEQDARVECVAVQTTASQRLVELQGVRKEFVMQAFSCVFPIEVDPLSEMDAGEEDYLKWSEVDCDTSMDIDEGWVLSGIHTHPVPNMHIVTASIPSNGDYSTYLRAVAERKKAYSKAAQQHGGDEAPSLLLNKSLDVHPQEDPYLSVPAALVYTAQMVELIADVLDQPLPYPQQRHDAISGYGTPSLRRRNFLRSVAKLDDNIMYLCFSQNVPLSALTVGYTLQNLLTLVTHTHLGRSGAFECHPELTRYRAAINIRGISSYPSEFDDSEPPNFSYSSDYGHHDDHSDSDEEDTEADMGRGTPGDYDAKFDAIEWEHLEPSISETRLFEEEQMKQRLLASSAVMVDSEPHRESRMRRLDYDSTYLDFVTDTTHSMNEANVVQLSTTDSVRLLGSIAEEGKGEESSKGVLTNENTDGSSGGSGGGIFGTLSSLWTSTFWGKSNTK